MGPMDTSLLDFLASAKDNYQFERTLQARGFATVAGSDEVGRGPLAGPVVAATVVLPPNCDARPFVDSKRLSHRQRLQLHEQLVQMGAAIGIGIVSERKIEEINILQASLLAMQRSVQALIDRGLEPDFLLVDGKFEIPHPLPQQALIKGESKSGSIAAASIVAKITRDAMMDELHERFPVYNFKQHKGYPTREHRQAIAVHGPCMAHRRTFRGVKDLDR